MCMCVHTYIHTYIQTYIHTYIHTHTHTHTQCRYRPQTTSTLTHVLAGTALEDTAALCTRLAAEGLRPVPHLAARAMRDPQDLEQWLTEMQRSGILFDLQQRAIGYARSLYCKFA